MTPIHTKRQTVEEDVLRDLIEWLREFGTIYIYTIEDIRDFARERLLNDLGGK